MANIPRLRLSSHHVDLAGNRVEHELSLLTGAPDRSFLREGHEELGVPRRFFFRFTEEGRLVEIRLEEASDETLRGPLDGPLRGLLSYPESPGTRPEGLVATVRSTGAGRWELDVSWESVRGHTITIHAERT